MTSPRLTHPSTRSRNKMAQINPKQAGNPIAKDFDMLTARLLSGCSRPKQPAPPKDAQALIKMENRRPFASRTTRILSALLVCATLPACARKAHRLPAASAAADHTARARPLVRVRNHRGEFLTWRDRPPVEDIRRFQLRFDRLATGHSPALVRALVRDHPDLALELYRKGCALAEEDARQRKLSMAWSQAFGTDVLLRTTDLAYGQRREAFLKTFQALETARRDLAKAQARAAKTHAQVAMRGFKQIGERFLAEDAEHLYAIACSLAKQDQDAGVGPMGWSTTTAPTAPQEIERRIIELQASLAAGDKQAAHTAYLAAKAGILNSSNWLAVTRLEKARDVWIHLLASSQDRQWQRFVSKLALKRGRPLLALRYAVSATRLSRQVGDMPDVWRDRLLMVRARLASGQFALALAEALKVAQEAKEPSASCVRASALAMTGEALWRLDRPKEAVQAFDQARALMKINQNREGFARQTINSARCFLRSPSNGAMESGKELERAQRTLGELDGLDLSALGQQLALRVRLTRAMVKMTEGRTAEAKASIDRLVLEAGAQGGYEMVEYVESLYEMLTASR